MKKRQPFARACAHPGCRLRRAKPKGKFCYYHDKVANGRIEPVSTGMYDKKLLQEAQRKELARLRSQVRGA